MRRVRRLARTLGVFVLAGGLAFGPQSSSAAEPDGSRETVDLAALPRGPRPATAYLVGATLHLPSGASRSLSFPQATLPARLKLLGPSPRGWVIEDARYRLSRLYLVKGSRVTKFWTQRPGDNSFFRLGLNGTRVMELQNQHITDSAAATVFDLDGNVVQRTRFNGHARLISFTGHRAVVSANRTWDWVIGQPKQPVSPTPSETADIRRNVLFVQDGDLGHGPTALGDPGVPAWHADFRPRLVSPDGSYVVGYTQDGRTLEIRDMTDGHVVRAISTGHRPGAALLWESDSTLVFAVYAGSSTGRALLRCDVPGPCERATPWLYYMQLIGVPFQPPRYDP